MKISNSKKELARIISENGGWRDGNYAIQDKDDLRVWFTHRVEGKPCGNPYWPCNRLHAINHNSLLPNWHQTILSREEYFNLYPAPDADGWIEWNGGDSPVEKGDAVDVKMRNGTERYGQLLSDAQWHYQLGGASVISYRLHKPEQAKSTAAGDDETTIAAKEELESMEYREPQEKRAKPAKIYAPSIESLAADYRNAKDYAERKQAEADAAKADAEAKLADLVAAGKALNLVISVTEEEPELVITDLLDLRVGDRIWIGDSGSKLNCPEGEYEIV